MPGGTNTLKTIRDAAEATLTTISNLNVYDHEPRELDYPLPAAVLGVPRVERVGLDEPEHELGRTTWKVFFPLILAVSHDDPIEGQDDALGLLGQVIGAYDNDETLGNSPGVKQARVVDAEPGFTADGAQRQLVLYTCSLGVLADIS